MKASFWKALEALGASGSARCDWKRQLGDDWDACKPCLKATGRSAETVIDPRMPMRRLIVAVDGEEDFVAIEEDGPMYEPIPLKAREVAEFRPHWEMVARALAPVVGFDYGAWECEGDLRRIGSAQDAFGHVRAVLLFMPPGNLGDYPYLFRSLSARSDSTVLFPTSRWITAEIEALRDRNGLTFVDLSERLAQIEVDPTARIALPVSRNRRSTDVSGVRAVIHAGNGLTWNQILIEVNAGRTILLKAPGQEGKYRFSPNSQLQEDHAVGMLMRLAVDGQWRNPSLADAEYFRVSKAFLRLRHLLRSLVPLPGQPFKKVRGAYVPVFRINLHPDLAGFCGSAHPED